MYDDTTDDSLSSSSDSSKHVFLESDSSKSDSLESEYCESDSSESVSESEEKHKIPRGLLNSDDLFTIVDNYGKNAAWYLDDPVRIIQKTKSGAFVMSNRGQYKTCRRLIEGHYREKWSTDGCSKTNKKYVKKTVEEKMIGEKKIHKKKFGEKKIGEKKIKKKKFVKKIDASAAEPQSTCYPIPKNFRRIISDDSVTVQKKGLKVKVKDVGVLANVATKLNVHFEDWFNNKHAFQWLTISRDKKDTREFKYEGMFHVIMRTDIGVAQMIGYRNCIEKIKPILAEFHHSHKKFNHFAELQRILNNNKSVNKKKSLLVSLHQYQKYFSLIFHKIVPLSLFGKHRNVKKLRRVLKQYFFAPFDEEISLTSCVRSLNISCITWLEPIKDEATRWSVIAKMTKWIFETYLSSILFTVFSVKPSLYTTQKVITSSEEWSLQKFKYLQVEEKKGAIMRYNSNSNPSGLKDVPSGYMKLIAKSTGVRPIYMIMCDPNTKEEITILKTLLQQLYLERHERTTIYELHSLWRTYATSDEKQADHQLHFVAGDIKDAYGSIIQAVLFDIVRAMFNEIPEEKLQLQWYSILTRPRRLNELPLTYKRWFDCYEPPVVPRLSIVTPVESYCHVTEYVKKDLMLNRLKDYIFNQTFQYKGMKYVLSQGVAQGSALSSILADIYYAHMTDCEFHSFLKSGTMLRYVDDFLYVSTDEDQAKRFVKAIFRGIPKYNCNFKSSKTQTTATSSFCKQSKSITYIGYRLNGTTLDVSPAYKESSLRYLQWTPNPVHKLKPGKMFSTRLKNMEALKLKPIILDNEINSVSALVKNAQITGRGLALRCVALIPTIFKKISRYREVIMKKIRFSVKKLELVFKQRFRQRGIAETRHVMLRIRIAIWKSFLRVFSKRVELRKLFCHDIKCTIGALKVRQVLSKRL